MPSIKGIDCRIYLNTGTFAAPNFQPWACVRSSQINLGFSDVDATCRGSGGYKLSSPTISELEVTGDCVKERDDAVFVAMATAARNKSPVDILVMDGDRTAAAGPNGSDGWRMMASFASWNEGQPLDDIVSVEFSLKPTRNADIPGPIPVQSPYP